MATCAFSHCHNALPNGSDKRYCDRNCKQADYRQRRNAAPHALRAALALLGFRVTAQQALAIVRKVGLAWLTGWLKAWAWLEWDGGRWKVIEAVVEERLWRTG